MITLTTSVATLHLSTGAADADGVVWKAPAAPDGWEASPMRQTLEPKVGADGSILVESHRDARALVLAGTARAPTPAASWSARRGLAAMAAAMIGADGTLTLTEPGLSGLVTQSLTVRYAERLRIEHVSPTFFRFQFPLIAPDPVKF